MIGNCAIYEGGELLFAGMNLLHIRPNTTKINPYYALYQLKTPIFRNKVEASSKPAINQASIPLSTLKQFDFICPPLEDQKAIASFLDRETSKIDTLIQKQEQLIKLLEEKRQAVISHAVTKGLDPKAKMKDSGVEWLGQVPEKWEVIKLKRVVQKITDGEHLSPKFTQDGIPFLSAKDIRERFINFNVDKFVSQEDCNKRFSN